MGTAKPMRLGRVLNALRPSRVIDRLVGVVSPERALMRLRHRVLLERAASFDAAKLGDSVFGDFRAQPGSMDAQLLRALPLMRDRSRWAYHNICTAKAGTEGLVADVIGTGIDIEPKTGNELYDDRIKAVWDLMVQYIDASGYGTLFDLERLDIRAETMAGNSLWQIRFDHRLLAQGKVPVQIVVLNPAQLSLVQVANLAEGAEFRNGVEVDSETNRPVAYHITDDPGNYLIPQLSQSDSDGFAALGIQTRPRMERIPAEFILLSWERSEAGQTLGSPGLATVLPRLFQENELVGVELDTAKVCAAFGVFITSALDDDQILGTGDTSDNTDGTNVIQRVEGGQIGRLHKGEDVKVASNTRPGQQIAQFRDTIRGDIAGGLRTSRRWLDRDPSKANFSASRADNADSDRLIEPIQLRYAFQKPGALYQRVLPMLCALAGVPYPRDPAARLRFSQWTPIIDGRPYVNPLEDIQAADLAIKTGLSTYEDELGKKGKNRRKHLAAWVAEQDSPEVKRINELAAADKAKPTAPVSPNGGPGRPAKPESKNEQAAPAGAKPQENEDG